MSRLLAAGAEAALRAHSRVALDERGSYRLVRLVRRLRRPDAWRGRWRTPAGLDFDLDLGVYPDCCMAFGLYELAEVRLIRKLLRPGDQFVDVGANIGYITLHAAQVVGPKGRVDAFEPVPQNRERLMANLEANGSPAQVQVHSEALSDRAGSVEMHFYGGAGGGLNHGASSMFAVAEHAGELVDVSTIPLDDALPASARPRLIKMDVEGAEPLVVAGMHRLLRAENRPAIVGELNPTQANNAGFRPTEWIRRVLEVQPGYEVREIAFGMPRRTLDALDVRGQVNVAMLPG